MQKKNHIKVELLAPAQNIECAKSAIIYGADAVYIGAYSFGARKNASNNLDDIKKLIDFAHKYNVKIYVTVNTILDDKELIEAEKLIQKLYEIKTDAIIIQDMGLLELDLPPIELHASTQCNIRTLEKVKFFENIGIKRAILARELSLEQIRKIKQNTDIELECFIHGALCVSYSGNCYMSSFIGGRSANRGECAQACRKKYSLADKNGNYILKDKYLLSLKDLCLKDYIEQMIKAGVTSFKIEGRLKDENYVKNTVLFYRKILDKFAPKTSDGEITEDFKPDINKTFNRGYTTYFIKGYDDNIFNFDTPKSTGEFLGVINKVLKNGFSINTNKKISNGDGLCFFIEGGLKGCYVNKVENGIIYPNIMPKNLKTGDKIYRNSDTEFEKTVKNSKTKRHIKTNLVINDKEIILNDGIYFVQIPYQFDEIAQNKEKMIENIKTSFKKTGDSIFYIDEIQIITDKIPFLKISYMNELRRELFKLLEFERIKNYKTNHFNKTVCAKYEDVYKDYRLNIHNKKSEEFYKKCSVEDIEYSLEKTRDFKNKELMRTKHCLRRALNMCLKKGAENKELFLIDEKNKKYPLKFDCKNCEMAIIAQ